MERRSGDSRAAVPSPRNSAAQSKKSLSLGDLAVARRTSLSPASNLTIENWKELGERICVINTASAWWIGDWLVYGESKYPSRYKDALAGTSLDYQTLKNYAWIARKFEPRRRRDRLSFQHHVEVAALSADDQDAWLDRAEAGRWSRNKLRRALREAAAASLASGTPAEAVQIGVLALPSQQAAWKAAASQDNKSMVEWMITVLDHAAGLRSLERSAPPSADGEHGPRAMLA